MAIWSGVWLIFHLIILPHAAGVRLSQIKGHLLQEDHFLEAASQGWSSQFQGMNAAKLPASFWQPALSGDRQALVLMCLSLALIFLSLFFFFFISCWISGSHAFIVPVFLQYWSPWPFLSHFSSYFPCRCPKAPGVRIFPQACFLPAPADEMTLLLASRPPFPSSWNLGHKKAVTSMLKCQDHGICPEGLSQTISAYSANTMNSLKKKKINKPKVIYTLLMIFLWCREYSILFSLPIQTGSHKRRWVIFKFLPCMWFTDSLHTVMDVKTRLLAFTSCLKTLAKLFQMQAWGPQLTQISPCWKFMI